MHFNEYTLTTPNYKFYKIALFYEMIQNKHVHKQSFSIDIVRHCRYLIRKNNFYIQQQ